MIINKVKIDIFRGFSNVEFSLGEYLTLIAGQNGTQKSTLLGILTQTFTIPLSNHPFSNEKPLAGGSYRSAFQEKFRLSPILDQAGNHRWTLFFNDRTMHPDIGLDGSFTVESILRKQSEKESIRFWQKGKRDAGSGYIQLPVIFLSLKRLIPIAEAGNVKEEDIKLTESEKEWFSQNYNKILLSSDNLESINYLVSNNKNTLGVSTKYYDWNSNSAGQDNIGRILLSVISFKRLMDEHPKDYVGGLLAIDEIDATLYPASQVKLLESLSSFCRKYKIQIVATTHSLHLLEKICELKKEVGRNNHFNTVYLKKVNESVIAQESPSYSSIVNNLNVSIGNETKAKKIEVYTEDNECIHYLKAILGNKFKDLSFPRITFGCNNLIELGSKKVPGFSFPHSIVVLDGDAKKTLSKKRLKNYICLPGDLSPESMLADFLNSLSDESDFWEEKKDGYSKQFCFKNYTVDEIKENRVKAKKWYNEQLDTGAWGREGRNLFKYYLLSIKDEKVDFINNFEKIYDSIVQERS